MEFGLIGEHLTHSFSKDIHERLGGYTYEIKELNPNDLEAFLLRKDFKAINVTIPYKQKVIPYLDEIRDDARETNSVNCIVNSYGKLIGYNTDTFGFEALLEYKDIKVTDKRVLVLGNGGASKAVQYVLNKLHASSILVASRRKTRGTISYEEIYNYQDIDIIVNTTPVGMYPHNEETVIDITSFKKLEAYVDVIYNPLKTINVIKAEEKGIKAIGGLYMLVAQAVRASEIFLGKKYLRSVIDNLYLEILKRKQNLVLIGMPSSGKSTIGNVLSSIYDFPYIDTDEEIIKNINMNIRDYFEKFGESSFRDQETVVIKSIYQSSPKIISTGGGVILRKENIELLKQNGVLIFIKRDLDKLEVTSSRPLSSNKEDLERLYYKRLPNYEKYADLIIDNNTTLDIAINEIREKLL